MLDTLLRRLKYEGHRVLIYSQMTRVIDLLEVLQRFAVIVSLHCNKFFSLIILGVYVAPEMDLHAVGWFFENL